MSRCAKHRAKLFSELDGPPAPIVCKKCLGYGFKYSLMGKVLRFATQRIIYKSEDEINFMLARHIKQCGICNGTGEEIE